MTEATTTFLAALPIPAFAIDAGRHIRGANAEARRVLGAGIEGRHFQLVLRQPGFGRLVDDVRRRGETGMEVMALRGADGRHMRVRVQVAPLDGQMIVTMLDLGEADEALRLKRDFITDVSHELKTPLTAILGLVETLSGPARNDEAARETFLAALGAEAQRMQDLVGDLLSLSRVEAETYKRPTGRVDVAAVGKAAIESLRLMAEAADVQLSLDVAGDIPEIDGDPEQLRQVIDNLLRNAVLHGGEGGAVDLSLALVARDPILRRRAVAVTVKDRGAGFDPVHIPRLTERFYRIDTHRARDGQRGTGLGLSIVKHIMSRHRGRLKIETEPGKGTSVTAIFPIGADDLTAVS